MRGSSSPQGSMFLAVPIEKRIPDAHPLRRIKVMADEILLEMGEHLDGMYSKAGRSSIPPERLLKATLLMAFYTIRSERMLCERLEWDLLFRWFLDMDINESAFNHSTFSHNRQRLIEHEVSEYFFGMVVEKARSWRLLSSEHFTVDGTLIEAWASLKSFRPKGEKPSHPDDEDPGNPNVNFHGEKRSNKTHASTTDPESKLARKSKGQTAKLSFAAHALIENRNGLLVDFMVNEASGTAECDAALAMARRTFTGARRLTLGADKGYDNRRFVEGLRELNITPHVASKVRYSAVDARTTRHPGYKQSQVKRKLVEEIFGWTKTVGGWRKTRYKGVERNQHHGFFLAAAYNLVRMVKLCPEPAT